MHSSLHMHASYNYSIMTVWYRVSAHNFILKAEQYYINLCTCKLHIQATQLYSS